MPSNDSRHVHFTLVHNDMFKGVSECCFFAAYSKLRSLNMFQQMQNKKIIQQGITFGRFFLWFPLSFHPTKPRFMFAFVFLDFELCMN